jgi:hypothetical protein
MLRLIKRFAALYFTEILIYCLMDNHIWRQKERLRRYRRYVHEAGAIDRPDKLQARVIDEKTVARERGTNFEISRLDRFRYLTRFFTHSGII